MGPQLREENETRLLGMFTPRIKFSYLNRVHPIEEKTLNTWQSYKNVYSFSGTRNCKLHTQLANNVGNDWLLFILVCICPIN